jgi:hypothetical protein
MRMREDWKEKIEALTKEVENRRKFIQENYPSDYEDIKRERDELKERLKQYEAEEQRRKIIQSWFEIKDKKACEK